MDCVISVADASTIYEVPLMLHAQHLDDLVCKKLGLETKPADLSAWEDIVRRIKNPQREVTVAMVGKYVDYADSYKSLNEALIHAGIRTETRVKIRYVDAGQIEEEGAEKILQDVDAILVPGGFGKRGTEGMIKAIEFARENKIPFLGICLGMQMAVIEFARHVCGLGGANSTELDPDTAHPVVALITEWKDRTGSVQKRDESSDLGGTMRLGRQEVPVEKGTLAHKIYGDVVAERHRHRYEVNNAYVAQFEEKGMVISAKTPTEHLPEMMELPGHPFFFAVQFHPEVTHTLKGREMLNRFVLDICKCSADWVMGDYVAEAVAQIREQVGDEEVILGLSGGVDSSVAAALIHRAIGKQLTCVFVDNGLLRKNEREQVRETFEKNMGLKLIVVDAVDRFMNELAGVTDPEQKRKIIGRVFVEIFQEEASKLTAAKWLAQGTIYPDVIPTRCTSSSSNRCAPSSRTKSASSASNSAFRPKWSIVTRSRVRASACASSAKSSVNTPTFSVKPTRSSSKNSATSTSTTRLARPSWSSSRSSPWASWATAAPTNGS